MKTTSLSRGAVSALLLSLALPGSVALAQDPGATPGTPVTAVAPKPIDPAQTKILLDSVKSKNWDSAVGAVTSGADVNAADKNGITPLMRAAEAGQTGLVQLLLQSGANVSATDKNGQTALHYAIPTGSNPAPKKKSGFGGFMKAIGGASAISGAVGAGNLGGALGGNLSSLVGTGGLQSLMGGNLTSLLNAGAFNLGNVNNWSAIAGTALQGDAAGNFGINQLLGGGGLINAVGQINPLSADNWTNLLSSVKGSNPQVLTAMSNLGEGSSPTQRELWGQFLNAASSGNKGEVTQLMQNPDLATLLHQANQGIGSAAAQLPGNSSRTTIAALLKGGAKTDVADKNGKTPASLAQERGLGDIFNAN